MSLVHPVIEECVLGVFRDFLRACWALFECM